MHRIAMLLYILGAIVAFSLFGSMLPWFNAAISRDVEIEMPVEHFVWDHNYWTTEGFPEIQSSTEQIESWKQFATGEWMEICDRADGSCAFSDTSVPGVQSSNRFLYRFDGSLKLEIELITPSQSFVINEFEGVILAADSTFAIVGADFYNGRAKEQIYSEKILLTRIGLDEISLTIYHEILGEETVSFRRKEERQESY